MRCPFFTPRLPHSRLLPKCQILLTKVAICDTIMVEEYTLVRGQTTRRGYLCATACTQTTMHMKQQEAGAGYDTAAGTRLPLNLPHAHAAGQYPSRLLTRLHPGRQTTNTYHPRLLYARACSRTRDRVAARLRYVSHKQQEDNVYAAAI